MAANVNYPSQALPTLVSHKPILDISCGVLALFGYSLKAGLSSRWLSGAEAGGGIRFDSAQRTTPKLSQLKREAHFLTRKLYECRMDLPIVTMKVLPTITKNSGK